MIYIPHSSTDVFWNFGLEYYLIKEKRLTDPVFLFWQNTPCLMLGKFQNPIVEINLEYLKSHKLDLVRRKSGGGTIYTDLGTFQYTFIQPESSLEIKFSEFIAPVLRALQDLGLDAEFKGRNDLLLAGKKISGTAQYKEAGYLVHHGSLLFDTNIEALVESCQVDPDKIASKGIASIRERVTNIRDHLSKDMTAADFKAYMVDSVIRQSASTPRVDSVGHQSVDFVGRQSVIDQVYHLTDDDRAAAQRLGQEEFARPQSFWLYDPKFDIELKNRFTGGQVVLKLTVKAGIIRAIQISGDFFASIDLSAVETALTGLAAKPEAVEKALRGLDFDQKVYQITAHDIASLFNRLDYK